MSVHSLDLARKHGDRHCLLTTGGLIGVRRRYFSSLQPSAFMHSSRTTPTRAIPTGGKIPDPDAGPRFVHASKAVLLIDDS